MCVKEIPFGTTLQLVCVRKAHVGFLCLNFSHLIAFAVFRVEILNFAVLLFVIFSLKSKTF
jgi:hypothetical protein